MSDFREQLRARIARIEGESRDAARAADQHSDARRQRIEQADATAETILRDVLRPLVDDFSRCSWAKACSARPVWCPRRPTI